MRSTREAHFTLVEDAAPPALRFRKIAAADVDQCIALIGPRLRLDARLRRRLPNLWVPILEQGLSVAIEDVEQPGSLEGCCLSAIVESSFADSLVAEPGLGMPTGFYRRLNDDPQIALTPERIRDANSTAGIDVLVLHVGLRALDLAGQRAHRALAIGAAGFYFTHGGYNLRSLLAEACDSAAAEIFTRGGLRLVRDYARERLAVLQDPPRTDSHAAPAQPADPPPATTHRADPPPATANAGHSLFALRREWVQPSPLMPLAQLFFPPPPRIGYSDSERRVLEMALLNESDRRIAAGLGVSADAVKKLWRRIFERTRRELPHLVPPGPDTARRARGPEKRSCVLDYLRTHLEELRPYRSLTAASRRRTPSSARPAPRAYSARRAATPR